jgi:ankyrin repeat protein
VRELVKLGADVDKPDLQGWTPLMHVSAAGLSEIARLLLGLGADPAVELPGGNSAIKIVRDAGHATVLSRLAAWRLRR